MSVDPMTRSELFLQYEAAGYLDLEPEEREALMRPPAQRIELKRLDPEFKVDRGLTVNP